MRLFTTFHAAVDTSMAEAASPVGATAIHRSVAIAAAASMHSYS